MATNRTSRSTSSSKGPFGNLTVGGLIGIIVAALVLVLVIGRIFFRGSGNTAKPVDTGSKTTATQQLPADDPVSGYVWTARDGSELNLAADGTFIWYMDPAVHEDNYIQGTYQVFFDEDARAKLTGDLAAYGITSDEIDDVLSDDLYYNNGEARLMCMVLNNDTVIMDGVQVGNIVPVSPTVGTYVSHDGTEALDLLNMETANDWYFTKN